MRIAYIDCDLGWSMKILLAIDNSPFSEDAVRAVPARPWPEGTRVRVLSCVSTLVTPVAELTAEAVESIAELREEMIREAGENTRRAADQLETAGLSAETAVREGDPRWVIVDEAGEWGADLIVVGSHGYTGIKRLLLGSIAQSVVAHAPCSVEVVRGPAALVK
jgi:nucleotide-binding universal stress UspA family protein